MVSTASFTLRADGSSTSNSARSFDVMRRAGIWLSLAAMDWDRVGCARAATRFHFEACAVRMQDSTGQRLISTLKAHRAQPAMWRMNGRSRFWLRQNICRQSTRAPGMLFAIVPPKGASSPSMCATSARATAMRRNGAESGDPAAFSVTVAQDSRCGIDHAAARAKGVVSGQPLVTSGHYDKLLEKLAKNGNGKRIILGRSHDGRPIRPCGSAMPMHRAWSSCSADSIRPK